MILASTLIATKDYPKARDCFEQELQIRRELSDREGESTALSNIALSYWAARRLRQSS